MDYETHKAIEDAQQTLADLSESLDLEGRKKRIAEIDEIISAPDFWNNPEGGQAIMQEKKRLESKVDKYNALAGKMEDLEVMIELAKEEPDADLEQDIVDTLAEITKELDAFELETILNGDYDDNNAILSIHPGAGGTESQDWAEMLYRMYVRWAERHGYKVEVLDYLDGDEAGIKSVTMLIEGENAYGYLKSEKGVHRMVRISPFDASGRRHTSFTAVEVMPEVENDTTIEIDDKDLKVDTYRSSGAGGQHVNKTESAVRITHIPTGIVVQCQNERSQIQNRATAMKMLTSRLVEEKIKQQEAEIARLQGEQQDIGWGSQIRSYVFHPYTLVKDHRTNFEKGNVGAVMDGEIDEFINAWLKQQAAKQLAYNQQNK
ncbi:MAG: peptide chain release factor 2 [Peptococcaceae bacterium]|jgi:peptide chain release factor 2|nr:peptide chain release factor 2 [Peptococcaceae bacterium]MEE0207143.1 peptide chain release factor 2 [Peptococcaceae bacterium]